MPSNWHIRREEPTLAELNEERSRTHGGGNRGIAAGRRNRSALPPSRSQPGARGALSRDGEGEGGTAREGGSVNCYRGCGQVDAGMTRHARSAARALPWGHYPCPPTCFRSGIGQNVLYEVRLGTSR